MMAYSNYGAFVYCNGTRMKEFEDCESNGKLVHGLIVDGDIKVECYKQGLPKIFKNDKEIEYYNDDEVDCFDFKPFRYELDGYIFCFRNENRPYVCTMITPSGNLWRCEYDYQYGAGFD